MKRILLTVRRAWQPFWLPLLSMFWMISACTPQSAVSVKPPLTNEAEIFLFVQPLGEKAAPLTFTLEKMGIQQADGAEIPCTLLYRKFVGADRIHSQSLLGRALVPAGRYKGLTLTVEQAEIMTEDGPVALQIDKEPLVLPVELQVAPKKAVALFLTFHADKSLESHVLFRPVFSVTTASQLPLARLGYISLPEANNVFIFYDNSMLFTGVIATGQLPKGMAMDRNRSQLYTALGESAIGVIDMSEQASIATIRLRPGDEPQEIALSPDGSTLVSANYGSNSASIVDPVALVERGRVVVGDGPSAVAFSPTGSTAYCMNSLSNTISVIDTRKMVASGTITLAESPFRCAINGAGTQLYVITTNSPNLLVIDLTGATATQKIFVGIGARSILVDPRSQYIYVGKRNGEIAIVDPAVNGSIDAIQLDGPIESMAIDDEANVLFALLPKQHALNKVNLSSKEVMAKIDLPENSYALSLVGAR